MQFRWLSLALLAPLACKGGADDKKAATKTSEPVAAVEAPDPTTKVHSGGMDRFKDPGVYIDGEPAGALRFGELPTSIRPVWVTERAPLPFNPGDDGPKYREVEQRRYKFSDYFAALGVDLSKVKELHIYGGNLKAAAVVIPGENLDAEGFLFRFGGSIWGKPLPVCPPEVGDGKCPDQISTLALYVDKQPPRREGGYFYFDDELIDGIPYFGEPIRGGVRVYLDGPLVTTVKRNKLRAANLVPLATTEDSETYKLIDFLKSQDIDTDSIEEAWLIQYERHVEKLSRAQLLEVKFIASQGESGEILVGDKKTPTHVIKLHKKALTPDDLPKLTKEELEKADG